MVGRRTKLLATGVVALAACAFAAAPAGAAKYVFEGDRGTRCTVEVGAKASDSLGALSGPPQVGYSSVTSCGYRPSRADGADRRAEGRRAKKRCRKAKKRGGKRAISAGKRRGCKGKRKRKRGARAAADPSPAAAVSAPPSEALIAAGKLELIAPGGVAGLGEQTAAAGDPAGFACGLPSGVACADSGRLVPALPGVPYTARFTLTLRAPPGEAWASRPAGCQGGPAAATCGLRSVTVTPEL